MSAIISYTCRLLWSCFIISILISCASDKEAVDVVKVIYDQDSDSPLVTFIVDMGDQESKNYNHQIRKSINYCKIPYQQLELRDFNTAPTIPPSTRVLVLKNSKNLNRAAILNLIEFVAQGNTIVFTNASDDAAFGFLSGVKRNSDYETDTRAKNYDFQKSMFPGSKDMVYLNNINHYGLKSNNFLPTIDVLATAGNDPAYPTIITHKIGAGKVVTFNTTQYSQKKDRGLYVAAILSGLDQVPYPIVNAGVIFLDDYPSPLYDPLVDPIKTEFNITQADFYKNIWWPDMLQLATQHQLKYTAIPAFDYRGITQPPFLFPEWGNNLTLKNGKNVIATDALMRSVQGTGNELGFHGYNHQSLTQEDWPDQEIMEIALSSAMKKWRSAEYGELPITYVPPSNVIDDTGLEALRLAIPSITTMSSLYLGDFEEGGDREFDPEPYDDHYFDFPRFTSGYVMDDENVFDQQSSFLYTGIWTHFVHPDDVYQIPSNNDLKSRGNYEYRNESKLFWKASKNGESGLLPKFSNYLTKLKAQYPMLRYMTAQEAVAETKLWRKSSFDFNNDKELISVKSNENGAQYWMMYVTRKQQLDTENQLQKAKVSFSKTEMLDGFLYQLKTPKKEILIEKTPQKNNTIPAASASELQREFDIYSSGVLVFDTIDQEIEYYVANGELDKAVIRLQNKISGNPSFVQEDWMALFTYLGYSNREYDIWPFLEQRYQKTKDARLVTLSRKLVQNSDYPYLYIRKTWMERQMELAPDDPQLRKEYNSFFNEENVSKLTPNQALLDLAVETDADQKAYLLNYLIDYDLAKAKLFLKNEKPCEDTAFHNLADRIAWVYANDQEYEKAIAWGACSNLEDDVIKEWRILNGEFEFLKETDYSAYITYLLTNNSQRALQELLYAKPCEDTRLDPSSVEIAYAFANIGAYRKALDWAVCTNEVPIIDRMQWRYELGDYEQLEKQLREYIQQDPGNTSLIQLMIETALAQNKLLLAYEYQQKLPINDQQLNAKRLNEALLYTTATEKESVLLNYEDTLDPAIRQKVEQSLRLQQQKTLETESNLVTDRFSPTQLNNRFLYGDTNLKGVRQQIGLTQTTAYSLPGKEDNPANRDYNLYGLRYTYASPVKTNRLNYQAGATIEMDTQDSQVFYKIDATASITIDSLYSSLQIAFEPAITGPAYGLSIYRGQATWYEELQLKNKLTLTGALEANYFTDGVVDGTLLLKTAYNFNLSTYTKLSPLVEGAGTLGNSNRTDGFPYWTIKERLYGGVGVNYEYNNPNTRTQFQLGTAAFIDTFSDSFLRYGGSASLPVTPYFVVSARAEFFTIKNFYSNNFNLGLKYYLK